MKTQKQFSSRNIGFLICMVSLLAVLLTGCFLPGSAEESTDELHLPTFSVPQEPQDIQPPVITGVHDRVIYQGDAVDLREGITVTDDLDENPRLEVDDSALHTDKPGLYSVLYVAYDKTNNPAVEEATVTVLEKKEGYASMEQICQMADSLLSQIVTDDMDQTAQVQAVYDWARSGIGYSGHSDKSDWYQAAWTAMTARSGDCFNYFAVCKLFFERLGIPNIDVRKVRNSEDDSDHFWSMVSVDGGESWYHFDATPRLGGGDFCMVTDAYLDEYSAAHKNSHNRDSALYPATPEE